MKPGAIVLAVDVYGNAYTAVADQAGGFSLNVPSGRVYALIFVDPQRILAGGDPVIGSLVRANKQNQAAAVRASANVDLGPVVVNPSTEKVVAGKEAQGGIQLVSAPQGLDQNGDGVITDAERKAYQKQKITQG
ncbi:MAG: hypothetical protein D6771_04380 [Zetaproteobacteria bacterium]|nr:MAG: hypothetical protein D6771_04380 [Zetaproteobacteria bacterium]